MVSASAYILKVPANRREILLSAEAGYFGVPTVTEPVPSFNHSRRAPLVVLASFTDGLLTHIASARKGASAGTELTRLNMHALEKLEKPIAYEQLLKSVPAKVKPTLTRVLNSGGILPPKTMQAVVAALQQIDPALIGRLTRLSATRAERIAALGEKTKENLALQKEALTTALSVAGIGTDMATVLPHAFGIENQVFTGDPAKLAAATNVFVGITRPRSFLGLAMRKSAASAELLAAAAAQQWRVIDLTSPEN